tara:strand:- start:382 stop:636 length:255 start_codon:yes stop_codon:yes gene_type:complete
MEFLTIVMGFGEEEATAMIDAAIENLEDEDHVPLTGGGDDGEEGEEGETEEEDFVPGKPTESGKGKENTKGARGSKRKVGTGKS